jgi:hypothetical protein
MNHPSNAEQKTRVNQVGSRRIRPIIGEESELLLDIEDQHEQSSREPILSRGMRVLEALSDSSTPLRLSEIKERAKLPMTTTHRLVGALVAAGALEQVRPRRYQVSPRLITALSCTSNSTTCPTGDNKDD